MFKLNIMADNIFDAEKDRRIQNLQQQSVSNIVRSNPNLRGVLSRYEDAEVSRLKLLELQQMRSKKITAGEKALLKTLRKGRRATGSRRGKGKQKEKEKTEPPKSQTQIEVDAEEKREKLRLEKVKQKKDEEFRQQKLFLEDIQEADRLANEREIARQAREQKTQLALEDRKQARILSQRERGQRQIQFEAGLRQQLAIEDRAVVRSEAERDARIRESDNQLRGIQDRVARDDAFRHAQLQEQQRLALQQLAGQQKDNERRHREQQFLIDNQRAVNAERAVSDRETIRELQGRITQLERQQFPEARGKVEDVEEETALALASGQPAGSPIPRGRSPEPEPQPEPTLSDPPPRASTPPRAPPAGAPPPGSGQRRPVRGTAQKERNLRARAAEGLEPSTNLRSRRRPDGTLLSEGSSALEITEPAPQPQPQQPRSSTPPRQREISVTANPLSGAQLETAADRLERLLAQPATGPAGEGAGSPLVGR